MNSKLANNFTINIIEIDMTDDDDNTPSNDIIPNDPSEQARTLHNAMQEIRRVTGGASVDSAIIGGRMLYRSNNEDDFSLTTENLHYQENNGLSHLIQPTRELESNDRLERLRDQTTLDQTQRAFFTGQSQSNTSRIESRSNRLELDDED
ncbi:MAG TPA: hypothetical protein PK616_06250 [Fibrobacteraceae bacterium]|nr:hypothetical protein [Fibrobacteraceae bacterium]